jgi:hypothetical protein
VENVVNTAVTVVPSISEKFVDQLSDNQLI